MSEISAAFPSPGHNHDHCVDQALADARSVCRRRGARFTEQRARVLELIWQSHRPLGAYQILDQLRTEGRSAQPPTVYRALDFLQDLGLVHRLASLNAYCGCVAPGAQHQSQFLICRECGVVAELREQAILRVVTEAAVSRGFRIDETSIEVAGICPDCARKPSR
ncbi:MAG TPA: transcriptional repressor [Chromatiaceae bacterium]|jgi:Fur family zinc uptake transcriptional regulator|nr:transcriptional repressor [Chromatiaceae bacterium]HIN82924.1 transcriptional repressor [Chromatiales bacterium]